MGRTISAYKYSCDNRPLWHGRPKWPIQPIVITRLSLRQISFVRFMITKLIDARSTEMWETSFTGTDYSFMKLNILLPIQVLITIDSFWPKQTLNCVRDQKTHISRCGRQIVKKILHAPWVWYESRNHVINHFQNPTTILFLYQPKSMFLIDKFIHLFQFAN